MWLCCEFEAEQIKNGMFFFHDHPDSASACKLKCIEEILAEDFVDHVVGDQWQATPQGDPLMKAIGWMKSSLAILKQFKKRCHGRNGFRSNGQRHGFTSNQAAFEAAAYFLDCAEPLWSG